MERQGSGPAHDARHDLPHRLPDDGSLYRVDPNARLVITWMIQLLPNGSDIRDRFPTLVYQALY